MYVTSQYLLDNNLVEQSQDNADEVIFAPKISVKKDAVDFHALETFAEYDGWTPTIEITNTDEDGNITTSIIDNPQTVLERCRLIIVAYVNSELRNAVRQKTQAEAAEKENQILGALL